MPKSKGRKTKKKKYHLRKKKKRNKSISRIIKEFKALNLSRYPVNNIKSLFREMGMVGYVKMYFHPGKVIMRVRPNESPDEIFSLKSELSYKPQEYNETYQRASTPNSTMFYGSVVPEDIMEGEIDNVRLTAALEASSLLRNNVEQGEEKLTFSKWEVVCDIPLLAIVYSDDFMAKSKSGNEMSRGYSNFLRQFPQLEKRSIAATTFLADEFAKSDIKGDYDYLISSIFTEFAIEKGLAGVYFPSVRADARGYNVAISPEYVDKCLKLVAAGECTLYKNGLQTFIDNDASVEIINQDESFTFEEIVDENIRLGPEKSKEEINWKY